MSDLYLVLRRRLEDVTEWVELGTETLRNARKARGLSYESMGRELNVASKTWERWEKAGRVPRHDLRRIADELDLEIAWPERERVNVLAPANATLDERLQRLDERLGLQEEVLAEVALGLAALLDHFGIQAEAVPPEAAPAHRQVRRGQLRP